MPALQLLRWSHWLSGGVQADPDRGAYTPTAKGRPGPWLPRGVPSTEENAYQGSDSRLGPGRLGSCVGGPLGRQPG